VLIEKISASGILSSKNKFEKKRKMKMKNEEEKKSTSRKNVV